MSTARELWLRHQAGERLSRDEQAALVAALRADETLRAELLGDERVDGLLRGLAFGRVDAEPFVAGVARQAAAERDSEAFVRGVRDRLEAEPRRTRVRAGRRLLPRGAGPASRPAPAWLVARRRRLWPAAVAAAILVGLGVLFNAQFRLLVGRFGEQPAPAGAPVAILQQIAGDVRVVSARGERPARAGQELHAGEELLTVTAASMALAQHMGRVTLRLGGNTRLAFMAGPQDSAAPARLSEGALSVDVRSGPGWRYAVETPHAELTVLGTQFSVLVGGDVTRAEVRDGWVLVSNRTTGESQTLGAGYSALIRARTLSVAGPAGAGSEPPGTRVTAGLLVLYAFGEGAGTVVHDLAGVGQPLHLRVADPRAVRWLPGGGLAVERPTVLKADRPAGKVTGACRASGAITLEAWIRPSLPEQGGPPRRGGARVVGLSERSLKSDVYLGQWLDRWKIRIETSVPFPENALHSLSRCVNTELLHVVLTRDAAGSLGCWQDGKPVPLGTMRRTEPGEPVDVLPGSFATWPDDLFLQLANDFGDDRAWLGEYHLIALYDRALSAEEVQRNYRAGPPH